MSDTSELMPIPVTGSVWTEKKSLHACGPRNIQVMAAANNWVMVRIKGCVPFTIFVKDLLKKWNRVK